MPLQASSDLLPAATASFCGLAPASAPRPAQGELPASGSPAPSSRSGGSRRAPGRCRRGSTRGTEQLAPMRVVGEALVASVAGPPARASGRKMRASRAASSRATSPRFINRPEPVGHSTCSVVAVKMVVPLQGLDQQIVHRKPDRPAPVRVAAEEPRVAIRPAHNRPAAPGRPS